MNYFNYYTEIEDEFVKRRGSHILVSPLDWSLMEVWKQRGIPLHIVLRGINSSFDAYDARKTRGRKVNSLFYCQQEVEAVFLEYTESRVGSNGQAVDGKVLEKGEGRDESLPFSPGSLLEFMEENRETLTALAAKHAADSSLVETLQRVILRLEQIVEDLQTSAAISPEALETDLTMIEEVILDGLKESVGEEQLAVLAKEGHQQLRAYKSTMEPEVYKHTLDNFIARKLRDIYGVPRLSLFYL